MVPSVCFWVANIYAGFERAYGTHAATWMPLTRIPTMVTYRALMVMR
jgi:hypothetical protein